MDTEIKLIVDLRELFDQRETDRLATSEIIEHLTRLGWLITSRELAGFLKPLGADPKQLWLPPGRNLQGYLRAEVENALEALEPREQADSCVVQDSNREGDSRLFEGVCEESECPSLEHEEPWCFPG